MPYSAPFHRLVVGGLQSADTFNFTMSIALDDSPMQDVNQTLCDDVAAVVSAWWIKVTGSGGVSLMSQNKLSFVKLNKIGVDGKYTQGTTFQHDFSPVIAGPAGGTVIPQAALAVTLRTSVERGIAARGRFYLPPVVALGAVGTDLRLTTTQAGDVASGAKALIDSINAVYTTGDRFGRVSVSSNAGAGKNRAVTSADVGRVVDTIRSRRNKLVEDYQSRAIA